MRGSEVVTPANHGGTMVSDGNHYENGLAINSSHALMMAPSMDQRDRSTVAAGLNTPLLNEV